MIGHLLRANAGKPFHVHRHRTVRVAADADPVAVLAVVEVLVLEAQDGQSGAVGKFVPALQLRKWRGLHVLVRQRQQRHLQANHLAELAAPEPGAGHHNVRRDHAVGRFDAGDPARGLLDARHGGGAEVGHAGLAGAADQQLDGAGGGGQAVRRDVKAAEDLVAVRQRPGGQQRVVLPALVGVDDPAFDAPRGGVPQLALEVLQPHLGGGKLKPAELVEARHSVGAEGEQLVHRVAGEFRHGLGRVGLEDQAGGVRGGTAGQFQRTLFDDRDVVPAAAGEFVREVGADDAGADDDDAW